MRVARLQEGVPGVLSRERWYKTSWEFTQIVPLWVPCSCLLSVNYLG